MKKLALSMVVAVMTMLGLGSVTDCMAKSGGVDTVTKYTTDANEGNTTELMDTVKVGINVLLGVIGTIAVVMIIVGGINYTTSQGDAGKVKKARDTILYGVIGLVVALLAFAIVNFVLSSVFLGK